MIRIGLTGTLGAGKSTVGRLFESWGAWRIDADRLAREAVEPGTPGHAAVLDRFGDRVRAADGSIDRAALRAIVFDDDAARADLEAIVHPEVDRLREGEVERAVRAGAHIIVFEIPLLYETGSADHFDHVVVVDAPPELRRRRVVEARGLEPATFNAIDAAQWSGERKRAAAAAVVWNDADEATLERRAREAWETVMEADVAADGAPSAPTARWRVDLHMHTSASHDCRSDPVDVIARAREIGLDRIAITDHNEIEGALAARELDPGLVIVAEEVRTAEGLDLIGLWIEERIPPGGTFVEVAAAIRAQGGVVYAPHPFDSRRGADEAFFDDVVDSIDAVEGFNARIHDGSRNQRAADWAARHGLPVGAGSDAHTLGEIGRGRVEMPPFDGPSAFLGALREGRIEGRASSPLVHLASTWAKLWP
ncbi:MAG TPA: dephospho-CoA kinase [Gemmatimonadota bacterium]|nr:dephospho-CoA kinase [Gemmatimonadota bacterium]